MASLQQVGVSAQVAVALVLVVVHLNSVAVFQPLRSLLANRLEQLSAVVLMLTLLPIIAVPSDFQETFSEGQQAALSEHGGGQRVRRVIGDVVLGLNVFFFIICLAVGSYAALPKEYQGQLAHVLGEVESSDEDSSEDGT